MYKVFIKDLPIILSTKKNIGSQYTAIPLKLVNFKKLIKKIIKGELLYINLYHKNEAKLERFLRKKLPVVEAAGGLVYNNKREILFIYRKSKWDLPKGKVEQDESIETAAIREVSEECGIENPIITGSLAPTYHTYSLENQRILKKTHWYKMFYQGTNKTTPQALALCSP